VAGIMKEGLDKNYSVKSLHRAIKILKAFSLKKRSLTLTELHEQTGLSKPSLQRILSTLVYEGFLQKEEKTKKYSLGLELYFLGSLVKKESNILNAALPVMERLRDESGEGITLNAIYQNRRRCIGSCESNQELSALTVVGHESPLYAGASAKVLLAHLTDKEIDAYIDRVDLEKVTSVTIDQKGKLVGELKQIRSQGYAMSYGERLKGAFSLSAPIFYPLGQVIAGISIVIPIARIEEYKREYLIELVLKAASEISNRLCQIN
jgi:IclR family KDG regulon transcriptional repressor